MGAVRCRPAPWRETGNSRSGIDQLEQMFDTGRPMASLSPDVSAALASLPQTRRAGAPRVVGALPTVPLPAEPLDDPSELALSPASEPRTGGERILPNGSLRRPPTHS